MRRCSTSRPVRGHRPLLQGTRSVPRSSAAAPRRTPARHATARHAAPSTARHRAASCLLALVAVLAAFLVPASAVQAAPSTVTPGAAIEQLAPYQGQATCDPVARPGAVALRDLVLACYPGTASSGIVRACHVGATSEHKEGRAWDWRVSTANPAHVAQVDDLMTWLLAPDEHGNTAAMARRLGIMYMIWDSRVWKSYQASRGWQSYAGGSPHTDHVHFSLSWAGAYQKTSYWTGVVAPTMYAPAKPVTTTSPATPTATIGSEPAPTAGVARRLQRRLVGGRLPGPWKRH